ncbi:hypothetical protein Y032_0156g3135 [Ancylostoma ceylanicum]|uniref:Uncharacterized protein n=1 Tax=Ancylostoma ceylanicum TaxID=53326 RepID=A0A016SZL2_9BILA|nr:hypothetical protein Y032_0156g3135 [Ancylostoma ceylanicum]
MEFSREVRFCWNGANNAWQTLVSTVERQRSTVLLWNEPCGRNDEERRRISALKKIRWEESLDFYDFRWFYK